MSEQKTLAEVLVEHVFTLRGVCACGWRIPSRMALIKKNSSSHWEAARHLEAVILAHLASEQVVEVLGQKERPVKKE